MDNCSDNVDMSYTEKTKIDKKNQAKQSCNHTCILHRLVVIYKYSAHSAYAR